MASKKVKNSEIHSRLSETPIAIIGMSTIFPGADYLPEYWDNILNKMNSITEVPEDRWSIADYYDPDPKKEDKSYCKMGGFINDVPFNPMEYGLPPNILEVTDVSQLLSLVVAKEALLDAGYLDMAVETKERTGVILGIVGMSLKLFTPLMARLQYPVWERALRSSGIAEADIEKIVEKIKLAYVGWTENSFPGTIANVIAGRIANRFDLGATNCVIDAACGSSLAAIRMAIFELTDHRADLMITGGVDTDNSIASYMCFSKTPAFSKSDRVRTFDENSDGMMVGEGLGMVVLKRLEDAERDGDRIYAVIKGLGSSSDGRYKSIYAPRSEGQAMALQRAYAEAGFSPETVGLIEAHGTGTMAGDPAEIDGLKLTYDKLPAKSQSIALGSVKSNIGHTKAAAGAAGLIKVSLALHQKVLPPTINVEKPNPKFGLENSAFYINTETRPWIRAEKGVPRRAGVSAFGFGGTNFHLVLEEYEPEHAKAYRMQTKNKIILLAAESPEKLKQTCQETLLALAAENGAKAFSELVQASRSINPAAEQARLGFVAHDVKDAISNLQLALDLFEKNADKESWAHPNGLTYRKQAKELTGKVVAMFSGQGSQYVNMGSELAINFPEYRNQFGKVDQLFLDEGKERLSEVIYPIPAFEDTQRKQQDMNLRDTRHAQPAIGTMSMALYKLMQQAGFEANYCLGHSFGELSALWAAGVFSDQDFLMAAKARGEAMAAPTDESFDAGTMLAVKGDIGALTEELKAFPEVKIANFNAPQQVVLAGATKEINAVQAFLAEKGFSVIPLPVSAAFHTPLVAHAQKPFAAALKKISFTAPTIPVYSNTTAGLYPVDVKEIQKLLEKHMLNSVQFTRQLEQVYADGGRVFIEFGPKTVITNLVRDILKDHAQEIEVIAMNPNAKVDSDQQFRQAVVQLKVLGLSMGDVDPYALERSPREQNKNAKGVINLSAGLYKTEKTIQAFETAVSTVVPLQSTALQWPVESHNEILQHAVNSTETADLFEGVFVDDAAGFASESTLDKFQEQQSEALRLHDQYLQNDATYTEIFAQLTSQQIQLAQQSVDSPEKNEQIALILKSVNRNMDRFHQHQNETARLHEQYIDNQADFTRSFTQLLRSGIVVNGRSGIGSTKPAAGNGNGNGNGNGKQSEIPTTHHSSIVQTPSIVSTSSPVSQAKVLPKVDAAPVVNNPILDEKTIFGTLLAIVAEKTGYPMEMIEPQMDMEADLGIDSIKRVEILGALQEALPGLPEIPVERISETRTLAEIAGIMKEMSAKISVDPLPVQQVVNFEQTVATAAQTDLSALLNQIVAEKTGYPVEMLEPAMDMESDLGIDSIKKVEIMGALQEALPQAAEIPAETLATLRTMTDILDLLKQSDKNTADAPIIVAAAETIADEPKPVSSTPAKTSGEKSILTTLIAIVAEKTGYPVEMLEPEMDMEADLGIDSIKRVEILGALQEADPELPEISTEEIGQLNTIQKIQEYLEKKALAGNKPGLQNQQNEIVEGTNLPVFTVKIQQIPMPDQLMLTFPENSVYLLMDQGTGVCNELDRQLQTAGWQTAVIHLPGKLGTNHKSSMGESTIEYLLEDVSDESIAKIVAEIHTRFERICGITVFSQNDVTEAGQGFVSEKSLQMNQLVFLLAKHLQPDLAIYDKGYRASFITVIRNDGYFSQQSPLISDPLSGGLSGLVKTLSLEWPTVLCRAIDIETGMEAKKVAEKVAAEILDPDLAIREVAYSNDQRFYLTAKEASGGVLQ